MTGFHNTFMTFANGSCEPDHWKKYFQDYKPEIWDAEGDGVLTYRSAADKDYSLVIIHWSDFGFLLQLTCDNLKTNCPEYCCFSLRNKNRLAEFTELEDLTYPAGCFLSADDAWLAVEDFLNHPEEPSPRIQWIEDEQIEWPDSIL